MKYYLTNLILLLVLIFSNIIPQKNLAAQKSAAFSWPKFHPEHRPGTYWWWLGSAVDSANLTYDLESLHSAGVHNVHIIPIYGVKGLEKQYIDFLSPRWIKMLAHTVSESKRLGMNVDMSTGTGWPFGGSHVTLKDAASKIEHQIFQVSSGRVLSKQIETAGLVELIAFSATGKLLDLTAGLTKAGRLDWTAPNGAWEVYALHQAGTGQQVKRAAPGNVGLVLDPYSTGSLKNYLTRFDTAFANYNGKLPRAQYHDSFEYYHANWTDKLFQEFKSRRGYDLRQFLPALFGSGDPEQVSRVKADYRATLSDLHLAFLQAWNQWAHANGQITRNEGHGAPGNLLDFYAAADIPETEIFGATPFQIPGFRRETENNSTSAPPDPLILQFASSAAHVGGKPLVAAETCTWLRDHFKAALSQAKPEIDQLFLSGINHIFYHGHAYSPQDAQWPGWLFYASTHFEPENAIWRDFPELNAYVTRCQSILQTGKPANDILLYWPIQDIFHQYTDLLIKVLNVHYPSWLTDAEFGKLASWLRTNGYTFDYVSDRQLQKITVENKKLLTGGARYKTIVIPKTRHIPLPTWQKLLELAENGATIIVQDSLPADVPGFGALKKRRAAFQASQTRLKFEKHHDAEIRQAKIQQGGLFLSSNMQEMLSSAGIVAETIVRQGIQFIRRTHPEGHHYFLANFTGKPLDGWVTMGVAFQSAILLDPRFNNRSGVALTRQKNNLSEIYLQLQPGESCIIRTFKSRKVEGEAWSYLQQQGEPFEITGEWQVDFIEGAPEFPASFTADTLDSWTRLGDAKAQKFAGTARYAISFQLPENPAKDWQLNLGQVRESARVKINGQAVGTVWSYPFKIAVGQFLHAGTNRLEVEVTNLSANRLRDLDLRGKDWEKFFFVNIFYKKFDAAQWPLMDSGLLGPVTLQRME